MEEFQGDLEYPLAIGSQELTDMLGDGPFLDMNYLQYEIDYPNYSGKIYLNDPDTTVVNNNVPYPTSKLPSMEDYPGPFNFRMNMNKPGWHPGKWELSKTLNKIFVKMECKVPLMFKWNQGELGLFVRALPVFLDQDSFEEPVRRCATHVSKFEKSNKGFEFVDHVIRCEHTNTVYEVNPESERLSVRVPLDHPQPGTDGTTIVYSFMCKNSCTVGMNRRRTGIIFTLERENGEVVGRKIMSLRICSCPRRDLHKEKKYFLEQENRREMENKIQSEIKNQENRREMENKIQSEIKNEILSVTNDSIASSSKEPIKRLMKQKDVINFQIRLPESMKKFATSFATLIKESIMNKSELTSLDEAAIEDCDKYLSRQFC